MFDDDFFKSNHAGRFYSGPGEEPKPKPAAVQTTGQVPESRYQATRYEFGALHENEDKLSTPTSTIHSLQDPEQRPTAGAGNNPLLNQSLNSSIRMNKKTLASITPDIARQLERKSTNQSFHQSTSQQAPAKQALPLQSSEDSVVELNIDDEGYLLDEEGNHVFGDDGKPMKLTEEQIEGLRENGLYSGDED